MGIQLPQLEGAQQRPTFDIYGGRQRSLRLYKPRPVSGYTAGWIRMSFSTEVGLRPDHIVLDGDPAPPPPKKKQGGRSSPSIRPMSIVAKRLDGSRCHLLQTYRPAAKARLSYCVRWDPASPSQKRDSLLWPNGRPSHLLLSTCSVY